MSTSTAGGAAAHTVDIEDVTSLTSLQNGMLYHCLAAERPGPYLEHFVFACRAGPGRRPAVDAAAMQDAWDAVVARHAVLRSGFVWQEVETPLQVTLSGCHVPVEERWLQDSAIEEVEHFLEQDRARGFDLARPPLLRVALLHGDEVTYLVWTVHHLVLDGWSMPLILSEVGRVYRARCAGDVPAGLPPAAPFRDYVAWTERQDDEAAGRFWRDRLGEIEPMKPLSLYPGAPSERRGHVERGVGTHDLAAETVEAVRSGARAARVSPSTYFQAAWALALSHVAPGPVLFGVTVASRPADLPGIEGIVGPCVNTVPQRLDVDDAGTVRSWLRGIQKRQTAALPHQHLALSHIRRSCGMTSEHRLFDSIFAFENYPSGEQLLDLGPGVTADLWRYVEDTGYPLTFLVLPRAAGTQLQLFHDAERFDPDSVRTLLGRVEAALCAMSTGPDSSVATARAATAEPSIARGAPADPGVAGVLLHRLVERQADRTPTAIAVDDHGHRLSYAELDSAADAVAVELGAAGVGVDDVVALLLPRSAHSYVGILGVLKAGAAYLALDVGHPDERLRFQLEDSCAAAVLTDVSTHDRDVLAGMRRLRTDVVRPAGRRSPTNSDDPRTLCYVTYTSGSTGRPKGVAMTHGPVVNMLFWELEQGFLPGPVRTLAHVSLTFDVSVQEIFTAWGSGGALVVADDEERVDVGRLIELIREHDVARCYFSPTVLGEVADVADRRGLTLPMLRQVLVAGELLVIDDRLRGLLCGAADDVRPENHYGSTEIQVVTAHPMPEGPATLPDRPPAGRPIDGVDVYVLDECGRPAAVGVPGAVFAAGAAVPRGYVQRPAVTADRFVPDPFAAVPGARMYDTGDVGVLGPDGVLQCHGRRDDQVKIRGQRVEPGEVRSALIELDGVRDAVVTFRELDGARRLIGHVVPDPGAALGRLDEPSVLAALRVTLPPALIPSRVVVLEHFPLTTTGKVDRAALPVPRVGGLGCGTPGPGDGPLPDDAAARPAEARMLQLWESVLPGVRIELDSTFFGSGGDSLAAIRLTSRLRSAFGVSFGVGRLLALCTPRAVLGAVEDEIGPEAAASAAR